jgi:serine/threonine protein kinase/tetratricopeptide (TPR) repeat protein
MGTVYKGTDTRTGKTVAIKLLKPEAIAKVPDIIERFAREGQALRQLNHPNIVKVLAMFEENGKHYLIIEYVSGGDLRDEMEREGRISIARTLEIALDLADALTRAHRLDIIHRDLKPGNVLIADDGTTRLTDFGVAHMGAKKRVTGTGDALGTLDYLPPEAFKGEVVDNRADIWSFGVMLFEMLTGQYPFIGDASWQILQAIMHDPTPDLEQLCPDAPVALVDLIYRMLVKDRCCRISSIRLVGAELEAIKQTGDLDDLSAGVGRKLPLKSGIKRFATPTPPSGILKHNIPAQATPFIGRETEANELTKLIENPNIRLITILAAGGMGKTRLALELASHFVRSQLAAPLPGISNFPDGIYFVSLTPLRIPAKIVQAIADATGFQFQQDGRKPAQQILDYLREKQMLLLMDSFEYLLDGANLISEILQIAPHVQIVVTSRERLQLNEETLFPIGGMPFPDWETPEDTDALMDGAEYSAVKLFVQSARQALPSFELKPADLQHVSRICRLVEGMPLGILLAATWVRMFSLKDIANEITRNIDFLETDARNVPERHRSFRAVFDSSWNRLRDEERLVMMKLSVFRGGFTRAAAQKVTGASLRTLVVLVEKSLLHRDVDVGRYDIHELLRQYVEEQLEASGDTRIAHDAHSKYYLNVLHERELDIKGRDQLQALNAIETDFENVRLAWHWAVEQKHHDTIIRALECLDLFCWFNGRRLEGIALFREAREAFVSYLGEEPYPTFGRTLLRWQEDVLLGTDPTPRLEQYLEMARRHDGRAEIGHGLLILGVNCFREGNHMRAIELMEGSFIHFSAVNDEFWMVFALIGIGLSASLLGNQNDAISFFHKGLTIAHESGNKILESTTLSNLGWVMSLNGEYTEAERHLRKAEAIQRKLGIWGELISTTQYLSELIFLKGDLEQARVWIDEYVEIQTDILGPSGRRFAGEAAASLEIISENYEEARQLCEASRPLVDERDPAWLVEVEWKLSLAACGLGDFSAARRALQTVIQAAASRKCIAIMTRCLPIVSIIEAYEGDKEHAVELLALAFTHPKSATGWMEKWPLLTRLRNDLQTKLGRETYDAALEHGKSLDLATVVQKLLAESE